MPLTKPDDREMTPFEQQIAEAYNAAHPATQRAMERRLKQVQAKPFASRGALAYMFPGLKSTKPKAIT